MQNANIDNARLNDAYPDNPHFDIEQDLYDLRTVLLKANRPIDVEHELRDFKAKNAIRVSLVHRHRVLYASLFAVAAALLAFFFLRPVLTEQKGVQEGALPQKLAMTTAAKQARYATISTGTNKTNAFSSSSTHLSIPKEAYLLKQTDAKPRLLSVPYGCSADLTLPDGSVAYVHAGSELSFSPQYINGKRVVILDGEAYFKVKHDEAHPFVVQAGDVTTTVYGTEFNINTHASHGIAVTLISGSVGVTAPHYNRRMEPGEQVSWSATGAREQHVDLLPYTNWRDGYLYYDQQPLFDILTDLAHNYKLSVRFEDHSAMHLLTHFVCERGADISTVIAMLNQMEKAKVRLENNTLVVTK